MGRRQGHVPDHPHAGGERSSNTRAVGADEGSSPRGWGEAGRGRRRRAGRGIIPTRVGRGPMARFHGHSARDHPHAGGERPVGSALLSGMRGSSPRGWGEGGRDGRLGVRVWIIPTRVGRGRPSARRRGRRPDHPHAGGERHGVKYGRAQGEGSSPRGWGEASVGRPGRPRRGIIPTRVGRGRRAARPTRARWDHPHAGGERPDAMRTPLVVLGSSPRGWGEARRRVGHGVGGGIIPTRVGRGAGRAGGRRRRPDHPHAGGERWAWRPVEDGRAGSSPRGWGEDPRVVAVGARGRIIPTRVGRGVTRARSTPAREDHPHAGGERASGRARVRAPGGSSPRGWGEAAVARRRVDRRGIIPTRVGRGAPCRPRRRRSRDHPHAGGERFGVRGPVSGPLGSSPRGWGEGVGAGTSGNTLDRDDG